MATEGLEDRVAALERRLKEREQIAALDKRSAMGATFALDAVVVWALLRLARQDSNPAARVRMITAELRAMVSGEAAPDGEGGADRWLFERAQLAILGWEGMTLRLLGALSANRGAGSDHQ
jgi:hypothetical protein